MDDTSSTRPPVMGAAKRVFHRLLAIGENRIHLLLVEIQEERNHLLDLVFMALAAAALGMLSLIVWTAALVICFWNTSPLLTLVILGVVYSGAAMLLCWRIVSLRGQEHALEATFEQLRKDTECFKEN